MDTISKRFVVVRSQKLDFWCKSTLDFWQNVRENHIDVANKSLRSIVSFKLGLTLTKYNLTWLALCACVLRVACMCAVIACFAAKDWCQLVHTLVEGSPTWTAHIQVQESTPLSSPLKSPYIFLSCLRWMFTVGDSCIFSEWEVLENCDLINFSGGVKIYENCN